MSSAAVVGLLIERGLTIAVAESLTGGMLVAELIATPGASAAVLGGVVAYDTRLKRTLLGVEADLLAEVGAVDPRVAEQMADRVRGVLAVDGKPADIGISTTGVAGPDPQDGKVVGTVYVGLAMGERVFSIELNLAGSRAAIRSATVTEALVHLQKMLEG